ncbi:MAG: hypothetical protein QM831_43125 [Kofleriaceae bacterium]
MAHQGQEREQKPANQAQADSATPNQAGAIQALHAVIAHGTPTVEAVAGVFHQFPKDRSPLLAEVQKTLGNGFVQQMMRANTSAVDRQLGLAKKKERTVDRTYQGSHGYQPSERDRAMWAQHDITAAQKDFAQASSELDDQDALLRNELLIDVAMPDTEIIAYIDVFHKREKYRQAQDHYQAASAALDEAMKGEARLDADFDAGKGEVTGDQIIQNYQMLAVSSMGGAIQAAEFLQAHAIRNAKGQVVGGQGKYADKDLVWKLYELQETVAASLGRRITDEIRARVKPGMTGLELAEAMFEGLNGEVLEPVEKLGEIAELFKFRQELGNAIVAMKAGMTPGVSAASEAFEYELSLLEQEIGKDAGPIMTRVENFIVSSLKMVKAGGNMVTGDFGAVADAAREAMAQTRELNAIVNNRPSPEDLEQIEDMEAAAGRSHAAVSKLVFAMKALGLVADGYATIEAFRELKEDGGNPFRYITAIADMFSCVADAMELCPPIAAIGAAFSIVTHGIAAAAEFCAAVWQSFEPTRTETDRAEILKEIAPQKEQRNKTISSERSDSNLQALSRAGIPETEIEAFAADPNYQTAIQSEGVLALFVYSQYILQSRGLEIVQEDQSYQIVELAPRPVMTFIKDAIRHFGGDIGTLTAYTQIAASSTWDKMMIRHWMGPRFLGEEAAEGYKDGGIYDVHEFRVVGKGQLKG